MLQRRNAGRGMVFWKGLVVTLVVAAGAVVFVRALADVPAAQVPLAGERGTAQAPPERPDDSLVELGAPRAWGAGVPVSPFSTVNLRNGNVLTALPLVSWDPIGPPVSFTLYHNSRARAGEPDHAAWGYDLGDGWSVSCGSHVNGTFGDDAVTVVWAGSRRDVFTLAGSVYEGPAGVHDVLAWDGGTSRWTLTTASQWRAIYDADGRLIFVEDSAGCQASIERDVENRIIYVASAADGLPGVGNNRLTFSYDGLGRLSSVRDPIDRTWTFEYEPGADGRLWKVHYPYDNYVDPSCVEFAYAPDSSRIQDITARDGKMWTYTYDAGRLVLVEDPPHDLGGSNFVRYTQAFAWPPLVVPAGQPLDVTYTDRRNYDWVVRLDCEGQMRRVTDPLGHSQSWEYDDDHNATSSTDELGHTWVSTYGPVGNVLTVTSPLATPQTWSLTWEQPDPTNRPNFWRVTQFTDPASHWVQYAYTDALDPTLATAVTEMADGQGNPEAVTTLEYYDDSAEQQHARGQLGQVIDANNVYHTFHYDVHGYLTKNEDGLAQPSRDVWPMTISNPGGNGTIVYGGIGQPTGSTAENGQTGQTGYDVNLCDIYCVVMLKSSNPFTRLGGLSSPELPPLTECFDEAEYDVVGRLERIGKCAPWSEAGSFRRHDPEYDDLGRIESCVVESGVGGDWQVNRESHVLDHDPDGRPLSVQGPDGQVTEYTVSGVPGYDALGRPKTVTRGGMSATFVYDDASRLERIEYANGTKVVQHYDDANRLEWIEQRGLLDVVLLSIDYDWNTNNTLASRTEVDYTAQPTETAVVTFGYDDRDQLISETRVVNSTTTYDIAYEYDQLGNRTEKQDYVAGTKTCYVYDTNWNADTQTWDAGLCFEPDPPEYDTRNNRLLEYREYTGGDPWTLTRSVRYTYYKMGHVSNITIKDEGVGAEYDWYRDLAFYYTTAGRLWRTVEDRWHENLQGEPVDYAKLSAKEFYYDDARARYLTRDVDPDTWATIGDWLWTDYAGMLPYGDFTTDANHAISEDKRYLSESGARVEQTVSTAATRYLHGDLLDSTMLATDAGGTAVSAVSYTAFGEPIGDPSQLDTRYQYAGGWGYESDLLTLSGAPNTAPITLQHVGERWYQPNVGRFVQRDLIGLSGGLNVYTYTQNRPTDGVDPFGLMSLQPR